MKLYLIFLVFSGITDGNKTENRKEAVPKNTNAKMLQKNITSNLTVPFPIVNVSLRSSSLDYLEIEWEDNSNNEKHLTEYKLTTNNNKTIETKVLKAKLMNLTECTNYCIYIQASNSIGNSEKKSECFYTKASNLSKIQLSNISSEYKNSRNITWNSTGSKKCNIIYKLTIINKVTNVTFEIQTNKSFYEINNFTLNNIYLIKVKATTNFSTLDNKKEGPESQFEFYTGEKNISIENLNSTMKWRTMELSINWTINISFNQTISFYMIRITGDSHNCMNGFFYNIQSSNAEQKTSKSRNNITECGNYSNESISFSSNFNKTIGINKNIIMFSLEIYGSNRFGIQKLNRESIKYKLEKPTLIPQLEFKERSETYFALKWRTEVSKDINKTIFRYRIKYLNISIEFDSNKNEANITSLNQCNKYCFNISTFNGAGSSPDKEYCNSTLAPNLSEIKLENILSGYETSRKLNWTYSGTDKCKINYQLEYWINNSSINVKSITNSKFYQISSLELNKIYSVRVRPFTEFDTENKIKFGKYSKTVQFYTGYETISISNVSYSMNWMKRELSISWNINKTFAESLFNYTIEILDQSTHCIKRIIYENTTQKYITEKSDLLKSCDNQSKVNITINTNFNEKIIFYNKTTKLSVEIFGSNLKGRQKLYCQTIAIEMLKPDPIENITVYRKDLHSMHLKWTKSGSVDNNNPVMGYRIEDLERKIIKNVTDSYFNVSDLKPCTKYCFNISAYNDAGVSSNKIFCNTTNTTNLSEVKLNKISSDYRKSRQINWEYLGYNKCYVSYQLEYWIKNSKDRTKIEKTNETKFEIHNLTLNEIYEVHVIPITIFDTANGIKIGNHSNIVEFFTGAENITVENFEVKYNYYEKKFSLSWSLNASLNFKIDAYLILIKDEKNVCFSVVERREQNHMKDDEFYKKQKEKLIKDNNCTQNSDYIKRYNNTVKYFEDIGFDQSTKEYMIELHTFNKLGFQKVERIRDKIQIPANSTPVVVISLLFILIIACLIYLAIRNREKLNTYFPFISLFPFPDGNRKTTKSEKTNSQAIQMDENKLQPVLDERFFDCNTLSDFLNKIDDYQRSLVDFPNYVKFMKENNDVRLIQEYAKLNNLSPTLEHQLKLTKFIGKSPFNLKKNRFRNILPFDQNLVYLKSKSAPDNYLNANYIPFSSDMSSVEYIASQGPIESTISDYILMIWEQNVTCIVMLTRTYEDDKFKCLQYWPDDLREICRYGNQKEFLVAKLYEKEETSYFERKFSLKNTITHEERLIYHIHMHMWMDFSAPDLKDFNSVLCRFQDLRDTIVNPPFLVHCSAGVGRTGTFICIDRIVRLINKGQQYVDVFKTVMELRAYRNLLVQRQSQYIFIHEFLNFYIQGYLTDNIQLVSTV